MKAILIGASGLTGSNVLQQLNHNPYFSEITVLTRRSLQTLFDKTTEHIIDFETPESWKHYVKGDVLFSALGTTLKQAGNKHAQYKVDYHYQLEVAKAAAENGVKKIILISSYGADKNSGVFYLKMKGELEESILKLGLTSYCFLRPGQIDGKHVPHRRGEGLALKTVKLLNGCGIMKRFRPISPKLLATAMINAAQMNDYSNCIVELEKVIELAEKQTL